MAVWDGTKYLVTPDGSNNLLLDQGAGYGSYITAKQDVGALKIYSVGLRYEVATEGAGNERAPIEIYITTSEDDATYTDYKRFYDTFTGYFRYFYIKFEFFSQPNAANRPKLTAFEPIVKLFKSTERLPSVSSIESAVPGAASLGDRFLITAGAHADEIAECVDSDTPSYDYTPLINGQHIYDRATHQNIIFTTKQELPYCLQGVKPVAYAVEINIANAAYQTVVSTTWAAGDYNHDKDQFFIEIKAFGGGAPAIAVPTPMVCVDIYDDVAAAWVTILTGPLVNNKWLLKVMVDRAADSATDIWAALSTSATPTVTAGAPFPASLISRASGLRVLGKGDTGSKAQASIYVFRQA